MLLYKNVLVENSIFFADRWSSRQEFGFPCLEIEDCDGLSIIAAALLKRPRTPPSMLVVASGLSNYDKLWMPPPNRDYAPCIEPSPFYTSLAESHGYLLVHTNGGLNQMRAGTEMYPSGEFAFVVFSLANRLGVLPLELNKLLIIVVVLSMALTPALNELGRRASDFIDDKFDMDV
ncbi:hypothetical protein Ancab_027134, partial [Ancistrocladus abbreviatus]